MFGFAIKFKRPTALQLSEVEGVRHLITAYTKSCLISKKNKPLFGEVKQVNKNMQLKNVALLGV